MRKEVKVLEVQSSEFRVQSSEFKVDRKEESIKWQNELQLLE
jgi:hypothetical protein